MPCTRDELGRHAFGQDVDAGRGGVRGIEQGPRVVRIHPADVARRDEPAAHGQKVWDEAHREAERLLYLGLVLVAAHLVGGHVLEHEAGMGARLQRAAGARDTGLRVHHDPSGVDRPGKR